MDEDMEIKPVLVRLNTNYTHANECTAELELRLIEYSMISGIS